MTTHPVPCHHAASTPTGWPPLLVSRDPELADTVVALTGPDHPLLVLTPEQVPAAAGQRCPLLLIGTDVTDETSSRFGASLGARKPVLLSPRPDTTPELWRAAVALRAQHVACLPDAADWIRDRLRTATRDNTLVFTVLDVCGEPHGTALAAALAAACGCRKSRFPHATC